MPWVAAAFALIVIGLVFVLVTGMRPAYDAYGWLVWGHQALHLTLNTNSAPSWKPLTFLFTLPYALLGKAALWLWMETAVVAALAGAVFAGRIAYHLTGPTTRRFAPIVAAIFAGAGVLGINGYGHFILIADSDPMIVTLCLAAIDAHLHERRRVAWVLAVLAGLGRPEVWVVSGLYGLWNWRDRPQMRLWVVGGAAATAALWFVIPALTSTSWLIAGNIAQSTGHPLAGDRVTGMLNRFLSLYELPMQLAVLVALGIAIIQRERRWLVLAGAAVVWVAVEIGFALHSLPPSARYMFEPAAVLIVLAGAGVGRLLSLSSPSVLLRVAAVAVALALVGTIAPHVRARARLLHNGIVLGRNWALQIHRLHTVIAREGGPKRILACGGAVTTIPFQSILAWELGGNVVDIGWVPSRWIKSGKPVVVFQPVGAGWVITPFNIPKSQRARCRGLRRQTATSIQTTLTPHGQRKKK
jgi:hypothetical protein